MDQQRVAGIGNLLADEILWRAGIDPARLSRDLDADAIRRLHRTIRTVLRDLLQRGGSHLGELQPERERGGCVPATVRRCSGAKSAVAPLIRAPCTSGDRTSDVKDS